MPFTFRKLSIPDVLLIEPKVFPDARGYFAEVYKDADFFEVGITKPIAQINYSKSDKNVLRGLHYQKNPKAQGKLMQVISGEIFDVAVDMRKGSPWYGLWVGERLSVDNLKILYIPEGFAHGFCVLSDTATITYYCTNVYSKEEERGFIWNDSQLKIDWPVKAPIVSERDAKFPLFKDADNNFVFGA
jgi:dTDP-4-dehydrorhamnose 3,5-epimerase